MVLKIMMEGKDDRGVEGRVFVLRAVLLPTKPINVETNG